MTSNPITCKHLLNHILGSMTHNPLVIRHDLYSCKLFQGKFSICTPNMPNCTSFIIFQWSTLLNIHSKCAAVIPFFIDPELFYNKLDSMKQIFSNTSELTKLHDLSIILGGRCPEFPYQAHSCKIIISLSIFT